MDAAHGQRGFGIVETVVAFGILAAVVLAAYGGLAFLAVHTRTVAGRGVTAAAVEAELVRANVAAGYTANPGSAFTPGSATFTPPPLPSGVTLSPLVPRSVNLTATTRSAGATPQLTLLAQSAAAAAVSGAVDLVQGIPPRGALMTVAAPTPIPQPQ